LIKIKVKINNTVYDSNKEPIMIILEDCDKENIKNMGTAKKYCSCPEDDDPNFIKEWMKKDL